MQGSLAAEMHEHMVQWEWQGARLRHGKFVAQALHEASHVMVHVVKDHVDAALEVVAPVSCKTGGPGKQCDVPSIIYFAIWD